MTLKLLLKRGALLAVANWQAVAIQFFAETTFQVLLAVPIFGAAILVAVAVGTDLGELVQGSLREMATNSARALTLEPMALGAFLSAFAIALAGGSGLTCLVKGGTLDVLLAAHESAGPIESEPITFDSLRTAARFSLPRFMRGCARLFRQYLGLGLVLMCAYAVSGAVYLACIVYGYAAAGKVVGVIGWTMIAAVATVVLILWITLVNLVYLLLQIAMAADDVSLPDAFRAVSRFVRAEMSVLSRMFLVILAFVVGATLVSALAWSGVGLIAFVPLVGLAVFPLQIVALIVRGLAFEYIGLAAAGAYLTLYRRAPRSEPRDAGLIAAGASLAAAPGLPVPPSPAATPSGSSGSGSAAL